MATILLNTVVLYKSLMSRASSFVENIKNVSKSEKLTNENFILFVGFSVPLRQSFRWTLKPTENFNQIEVVSEPLW